MVVRHPLPGVFVAGLAALVASTASMHGALLPLVGSGLVLMMLGAAFDPWPGRIVAVVVLVGAIGALRADGAWSGIQPRHVGTYQGWATVMTDPQPYPSSTRVVLEIEGERFEHWARGRARRIRIDEWQAGDRVLVRAMRESLDADRQRRVAWQHVVGEAEIEWVADVAAGGGLARASNRVRDALERGASVLPTDDAALFRGLVIGDDRDQPDEMIGRFRASGLSHLTAVSGQNVAFVLAAAAPLLRRLRPAPRWVATVGLIAWFVALTRFEPSIMRAGAMAVLSATGFALGRERAPVRLLALAVIVLVLIDPLLVGSVGFWLSVGATGGVTMIGPWLGRRLRLAGPLAVPLGITLGAQAGVAVPALLVFGRMPLVSIPANLLAVPVAGAVMLYGLPAGLVAGVLPPVAPLVMFPCRLGVRWVDLVAQLGERVEPGGNATWAGWAILLGIAGVVAAAGAAGKAGNYRDADGGAPPHR